MNREHIMICNVAWMKYYNGETEIRGNQAHIKLYKDGGERFNFSEYHGRYYGYVAYAGRGQQIRIEELKANKEDHFHDDFIDDVLIIWVAKKPRGRLTVVGWYDHARVYRELQPPPDGSPRDEEGFDFIIEADVLHSKLIAEDRRTKQLRMQLRQYSFIAGEEYKLVRKDLLKYIASFNKPRGPNAKRHLTELYRRIEVEKSAIDKVTDYYLQAGYEVKTVERDNVGWDLEAAYEERILKLEVKGLSGSEVLVQLTPNEYEKMRADTENYRLCIVNNALNLELLELRIFAYDHGVKHWRNVENAKEILELDEKTVVSAIARAPK